LGIFNICGILRTTIRDQNPGFSQHVSNRIADSHHFNADPDPVLIADPDPAFNFNADSDPDLHQNYETLQGSILSLQASIVSVQGSILSLESC
jgi:hypothetical protein